MAYRRTARTEAKRQETRERIAAAAERLVAEGGYQAALMSAVAAGAGVGVGTVYRHFPSKGELFAEVFRRASQREVDAVAAAAASSGSAGERLVSSIEAFSRRALAGRRLAWALLVEPVDPLVDVERLYFRREYRDLLAAVISDGIATGELREHDPQLAAAALVGAIAEALVGPLSPTAGTVDADDLIAELVDLCLCSVTQKGTRDEAP